MKKTEPLLILSKMALQILVVIFGISCESNIKEVQKIYLTEISSIGEAKNFNLKYTDSGKIKAVLVSPQMVDYSTAAFPFNEFPKGIHLTVYDNAGNKSFVTAKYAISYTRSNIIELTNQVKIITHDGKKLETEQLYYDQKNEWFFTQKPYQFTDRGSVIHGNGIDFSKDFKNLDTQQIKGTYSL